MQNESMMKVRNGIARRGAAGIVYGVVGLTLVTAGCDRFLPGRTEPMPPIEEVERIYRENGLREAGFQIDGNVIVISVSQDTLQLQRGGSLWARVGPYIYLFNAGTQVILEGNPGVAAVRVITATPAGTEIARATLQQNQLNAVTWRRALNLTGHAVNDGTRRPSLLFDLVQWGEQQTTFSYNRDFVPEAGS